MKLLQIFSLFVVCNATVCTADTYCTGECTCGSSSDSNTCDKTSFCKNPVAADVSGIYLAKDILAHGIASSGSKKYCIKKTDEKTDTAANNDCDADWVCNTKTGGCVNPATLIPANLKFAFGPKLKCLTSAGDERMCRKTEYCDRTKTKQTEVCLPYAQDKTSILKADNQKKICPKVSEAANITDNGDYNKLVTYKVCELDTKCVDGNCLDLCQESVICSSIKNCICDKSSNIYDCNNQNLYCPKYNDATKPTNITTIQYLSHGELAIEKNSKYCADSEKLSTSWTIAKVCVAQKYCNYGATQLNDLCRDKGDRLDNYKEQSASVGECYYKNNITTCGPHEFCYENVTTPENACLGEKKLDAKIIINAVKAANDDNDIVSGLAIKTDQEKIKGDVAAIKSVVEKLGEVNIAEEFEKIAKEFEKIDKKTNEIVNNTKKSAGADQEEVEEGGNGVKGIATGAVIIGAINLILIGSVLVILLCCSNKKSNPTKKENA